LTSSTLTIYNTY